MNYTLLYGDSEIELARTLDFTDVEFLAARFLPVEFAYVEIGYKDLRAHIKLLHNSTRLTIICEPYVYIPDEYLDRSFRPVK